MLDPHDVCIFFFWCLVSLHLKVVFLVRDLGPKIGENGSGSRERKGGYG
jgi:hypothetical protein